MRANLSYITFLQMLFIDVGAPSVLFYTEQFLSIAVYFYLHFCVSFFFKKKTMGNGKLFSRRKYQKKPSRACCAVTGFPRGTYSPLFIDGGEKANIG
jgi:hypothetical protein